MTASPRDLAQLLPALRQYRHNDSDEFVFGLDIAETERIFSGLLEDRDQQRAMKAKAREQRDKAAAMLRELANATLAIIAISDRKHDAWDAAKSVIAKVRGNLNQPERPAKIITDLVQALELFLDNPTPIAEYFDAARSAILAAHNQPTIGSGLQFLSAKDGKHWPTIGDKYLVRINGVLQNEVFEFDQGDSDFGGGDFYWDHNRDTECPLFNSESDEWLPLFALATYRQQEETYD